MAQVGRISGGILQDNLLRQGIDLAFETDLLYLKVSPEVQGSAPEYDDGDPNYSLGVGNRGSISQGIGINTNAPNSALTLPTTYQTTNLLGTYANIANFAIDTSRITNLSGDITLTSTNNIFATAIATDDLKLDFNRISSTTTNTNIELRPNGDGALNIQSNWNISGNLHSTGNITFGGNLVLGDSDEDNVTFESDVNSSLIPDQNNVSALGSPTKQWRNLYSNLLNGQRIELDTILIEDSSLSLRQGNTYYVSTLGSDTNVGDHQHGAFRTLKHALEVMDGSTAGPTVIHIFPGIYEEEFPLTVPPYVTIHGEDIRNTIIKPTTATRYNDAFLVEGDVTIEHITIKDFYTNTNTTQILSPPTILSTPGLPVSGSINDFASPYACVDSSGNYAIVGESNSNSAQIYDISTGQLIHTLYDPAVDIDWAVPINWGRGVAIDGNYAVVIDWRNTPDGYYPYYSYVMSVFDVTTGNLLRSINVYRGNSPEVGPDVDLSGNYAIIGGRNNARIYDITTGNLVHDLVNPTPSTSWFGQAVSISGNTAVVSDPTAFSNTGIAYIFDVTTGSLLHTINHPAATTGDNFGKSVKTDGTNVIIGAPKHDIPSTISGIAYIFNASTGNLVHTLASPTTGSYFGNSVDIDGNYAIVSSPRAITFPSDKVFLYNVTTGALVYTWDNPDLTTGVPRNRDFFGFSISISGSTIMATNDDYGGTTFITSIEEPPTIINPVYAFRFTPGGLVSTRSPYIRNVTVITKGSVTTASDPRGFAAGNAGAGAYIDGSVLDSASLEASMLFHGCTFITPGVDCVTMTNGVRVEWLNSFTYFANRGLYATQGVTGKIMPDLTVRYGAEIRSIGSANVYGNYGAEADGADTLMYLIGHNFAYIGAGSNVSNDNTLTVDSQETIELNSGKIYYTSTNEDGTYRVGDAFYVDFETGTTSIDASLVDFSGVSNINIRNGNDTTYIDGSRIDIGNIRISGNTIDTIDGPLILSPVTELFNTDTNPVLVVSKGTTAQQPNLTSGIRYNTQTNIYEGHSTGGLSFGGIYSTDRQTSVKAHPTNNTLIFTANNIQTAEVHHYGLRLNGLSNDNLFFNNNSIVSTLSNSDIELRRSGESALNIFNFNVIESTLTNSSNNALTIASTGRGYAKFDSTTGLVIPFGTTAERPSAPQAGDTRWNTELDVLEVYSGTVWQRAAGEGESVTEDVLRELTDIWTLVLG